MPAYEIAENPRTAAMDEMRAKGYDVPSIAVVDLIQRVDAPGEKPGRKSGWYIYFESFDDHAQGSIIGILVYGDWRAGGKDVWCSKKREAMSSAEMARLDKAVSDAKKAREAMLEMVRSEAVDRAVEIWDKSSPAPEGHPFIAAKNIKPYGVRVSRGKIVVPVHDAKTGEICSLQFIDTAGEKKFLKGGKTKPAYFAIEGTVEALFVVEGFATGATVNEATGNKVYCAFNAGNLVETAKRAKSDHPSAQVIVAGDDDHNTEGNPGKTKASEAAQKIGGQAIFPEFANERAEGDTDFNDLAAREGLDAVIAQLNVAPKEWPEPLDVFATFDPPAFPTNVLPDALNTYVADRAEIMGTDPGVLGAAVLVVCASAIDDGHRVQVKRYDTGWTESPRLWVAMLGEPSTKKSPTASTALRPIRKIEKRWSNEDSKLLEEYATEKAVYEKRRKAFVDARVAGKDSTPPLQPPEPVIRRLLVEDTTTEALGAVLKYNERGVLCFSDELTGWFGSMGAYKPNGASKDRGFWLSAYNGESGRVDRIGRGSHLIQNISVSMLGGIQERPLRKIAKNMEEDGMLQRFMIVCARQAFEGADRPEKQGATDGYHALVEHLAELAPQDEPYRYDEGAHEVREAFSAYVGSASKIHALAPSLRAHFTKLEAVFSRLALTLHIIEEVVGGDEPSLVIGEKAAQRADTLLRDYFVHHAFHFYGEVVPSGPHAEHVNWIAGYILAHTLERITVRDIVRSYRSFKNAETRTVQDVMEVLQNFGWVEPEPANPGKGTRAWSVNPLVHSRYTEKAKLESKRREIERANLKEIFETIRGDKDD